MHLIGEVGSKDVIILDDIADTCNTMIEAARILKNRGARKITAVVIHAIFSGNAIENLAKSSIDNFIMTTTIPDSKTTQEIRIHAYRLKLIKVDISNFLGECIQRLQYR